MKSDALISGFFWFFIIVGVLALAGIYWLLVVALPAAITSGIFRYQIRLRKKTLAYLKPRPNTEIDDRKLVNKDYASYVVPKVDLVELDRYSENHMEIAKTAKVSKPETLAMNGGAYFIDLKSKTVVKTPATKTSPQRATINDGIANSKNTLNASVPKALTSFISPLSVIPNINPPIDIQNKEVEN